MVLRIGLLGSVTTVATVSCWDSAYYTPTYLLLLEIIVNNLLQLLRTSENGWICFWLRASDPVHGDLQFGYPYVPYIRIFRKILFPQAFVVSS